VILQAFPAAAKGFSREYLFYETAFNPAAA